MFRRISGLRWNPGSIAPFAVLGWLLIAAPVPCGAVDINGAEASETKLAAWEGQYKEILEAIDQSSRLTSENKKLRNQVEAIINEASSLRDKAIAKARQAQSLLNQLGPPPEGDAVLLETPSIKEKREQLSSELASYQAQYKQAGLVISQGEQILTALGSLSRERLKRTLGERSVSPLSIDAWSLGGLEFISLLNEDFIKAPVKWWEKAAAPAKVKSLSRLMTFALLAALAMVLLRLWLLARWGPNEREAAPSYARRLQAGLGIGVARGLIPVFFILVVRMLIIDENVFADRLLIAAKAITESLAIYFFAYALISAALAPRRRQWRVTSLDEKAARLLVWRLNLTLIIFVLFDGLAKAISLNASLVELESIYAAVFALTLAPAMLSLTGKGIWAPDTKAGKAAGVNGGQNAAAITPAFGLRLRTMAVVVLLFLLLSALLGYSNFTIYFSRALTLTGIILGALWLARAMLHEAISFLADQGHEIGREIRQTLAIDDEGARRFVFWTGALADLCLLLAAGILMLPAWGLGMDETAVWIARIFRGVQIGSHTFSLSDIFLGLALFVLIIVLTKLTQQTLSRHVLPNVTSDRGVSDAIKTGVGYVGITIAAFIGISVIGIDLTNLALIVGALSVGIGFGLQNVINNFVSGLILLAERPIKPGDWVIVGAHEGKVKKVNVRSTEIETFKNASVIIPNADMIANPVINWTHKNLVGRIDIAIGVAYDSDIDAVEKVLIDCASQHPNAAVLPAPDVLLVNFGESSLDFELRVHLKNVETSPHTASDLRKAINKAFRAHNIEIPFPQQVVHNTKLAQSKTEGAKKTKSRFKAKK